MSPLTIQVLRRLSLYALVLAVLLLTVPRLLLELGLIGPSPAERVAAAERAIGAVRAYGAEDAQPALKAALEALAQARAAAGRGENRAAQQAARRALAQAIEAQRLALADGDQTRRRAEAAVEQVDRALEALEDLYRDVSPGLPHEQTARLLGVLKSARQTGAVLFLAFEQRNYRKVVEQQPAVEKALAEARAQLEAARVRPAGR